jgi:hypothetical protein
MMRAAFFLCAATIVACVDGTTPDCTTVASGCFPQDTGTPPTPDASDASSDAASDAPVADAPTD